MLPIRAIVNRYATWRTALAAMAAIAACIAGLLWRRDRLGGLELLDSRLWYTPEDAEALFDALDRLDAGGRVLYAATGLTIDLAFPVAYGLLFAILLFRLFRAPLYLLPLAAAAADVLENLTVAVLALGHDGAPSALAWFAAAFTLVKAVLCYATLAMTGVGGVLGLSRRLQGRHWHASDT